VATQEKRKAETRQRLLDAGAALFAERGIEAVSIDAIADAADRTSGAVYAHFGGKAGLLTALLESLVDENAAVMHAELSVAIEGDAQLAALWRTFANPPPGPSEGWMLLEHELWLYANRHDEARSHLAARYAEARRMVVESLDAWTAEGRADAPGSSDEIAPLLIALLLGLEMQHRLDPDAVSDDAAVVGLRALTGLGRAQTETAAPSTTTRSTTTCSTPTASTRRPT
jgi:AcrR family transcriptional regulator